MAQRHGARRRLTRRVEIFPDKERERERSSLWRLEW